MEREITDMQVANVELTQEEWAKLTDDDNSDRWEEIKENCTFDHTETCEFILYLSEEHFKAYEEPFGAWLVDICRECLNKGFQYVCFYA